MVTGDNLDTAIAIAKEAGIIPSGGGPSFGDVGGEIKNKTNLSRYGCLTGAEFRRLTGGLREETSEGEKREVICNLHAFRDIVK